MKLALSPELDHPAPLGTGDCPEVSDARNCDILGEAGNRMVNMPLCPGIAKPELKMKLEKGFKKIYVPKQQQRVNKT